MDIEEVAKTHPESLIVWPIDCKVGLTDADALVIAKKLDLSSSSDLQK